MHILALAVGLVVAFWIFAILVFITAAFLQYWPVIIVMLLVLILNKQRRPT